MGRERGKGGCHHHLNVVVETAVLISVLGQEGDGLARLKVFKLHDHIWPPVEDRLHEFVHKREVFLALDAITT